MPGSALSSLPKSLLVSFAVVSSPMAVTVAERGAPSISASSPKQSSSLSARVWPPGVRTRARPFKMMCSESPRAPARTTVSPSA